MRQTIRAVAVAFAGTLLACGTQHGRSGASTREGALPPPTIRLLGRVPLSENDSVYVGRPTALAVDQQDGSFYVADAFWGRILRFSPRGELLRVYGKRGEGPGELKGPGAIEVADGVVNVDDIGASRVTRYGRNDGAFLGSMRYRGLLTSIHALGGRLWFGGLDVERRTSLGTWTPGEREVRALGTAPEEFIQSPPLAGIYTGVEVAPWGDTVVAGYMGLNRLTVFRTDGTPIRSVSVPVRVRKGEMPNVVRAMEHLDFPAQFSANSALFRMARLPSGNLALVHYDQSIDGDLITARVYLTLLSPDLSRACVDREIPVTRDAQPYTAFRGDTLFVIQQQVSGEKSAAFVDRYLIDELACPGVPARSRGD